MIDDPTAVTTVHRDWAADEAAAGGVGRELVRLGRRAGRRWLRTLATALVCGALVGGVAALRPRRYASRVVFAVTPAAGPGLRDYVATVVLSRSALSRVVADRGLYPSLRDPALAVDRLRDALAVVVEPGRDGGRSSRLVLRFEADDADAAFATARQLGRIVAAAPPRAHSLSLLEPAAREEPPASRAAWAAWLALCAFLLALPLCAIAVGALDPRIYDLDDVRRLGLPVVGAVRPFVGDNAGALVARLRDERRARIARK